MFNYVILIIFIVGWGYISYKVLKFIWSFLSRQDRDWQYEQALDVLDWCYKMYPIRPSKPKLSIIDKESEHAGEYCFYINTIIIYRSNNVLQRDLVDTIIHEWFHWIIISSKSKNDLYQKQLIQFGYHDHPQEIMCRTMAKKLTKRYLRERK
jgi:hypothetical protein